MIRNYLKIALRNLMRQRLYAVVNVLGLAVGLACCLTIYLFIRDELKYDTFHEKADRTYRLRNLATGRPGQPEPEHREVLVLSRFQELRYEEIARILVTTQGAVKVRVHRAMNELKKIYLKIEQ